MQNQIMSTKSCMNCTQEYSMSIWPKCPAPEMRFKSAFKFGGGGGGGGGGGAKPTYFEG